MSDPQGERGDTISSRAGSGAILAFVGAKGGVGTTTLALNAASLLARHHRVILTELRPQCGALYHYFRTRPAPRNLADLLAGEPARTRVADVQACLWQYTGLPGLRVLFGPQSIDEPMALSPAHVRVVLDSLAQLADYVVLDLPPACSEANRAAVQRSDLLALVLERDPICLLSARVMLEAFEKWKIMPQVAGAVVVNRVALALPFDLSEVETQLGIPLFGAIPPAPELCLAARQALTPLVVFDADSLAAGGIGQFVLHLRIRSRVVPDEPLRGSLLRG
ncbi:hypothetical protein SBA6_900009 [Candidatus Sulfopaludibacter sp. SbA6]|nr:hypothetical protein SBA6_900009 [Candidatus Sulfopaludibacter sp. SbA6]